ncbi:ROK family protein, partial [Nonomuraea sp. NPDC050691]|uniref:ROK family protein n=1 Tax=Nonomuraea sp. NPDC050691 TaxID=3155661 RepID=UPI00340BA0A6
MIHSGTPAGRRLGVDVGGTDTKWVLLDGDTVAAAGTVPTPSGPDETMTFVAALAGPSVEGIGIALPGHVDRETGTALFMPNPPGDWDGYPAGPRLSALSGKPVAVVNDARAFAQAELRLGAARGLPDALFAVLGTGVGGAVALRGAILVGPRDNLGEVGHVTVDPWGAPCCCGNRGCVETFAGGPGIVRAFGSGPAAAVAAAARAGD